VLCPLTLNFKCQTGGYFKTWQNQKEEWPRVANLAMWNLPAHSLYYCKLSNSEFTAGHALFCGISEDKYVGEGMHFRGAKCASHICRQFGLPKWLAHVVRGVYEDVSKSFLTGCLERELQMVQLSATIAILWVSLVTFVASALCFAFKRMFIVVSLYFVIDSVWKLLDTPSYASPIL
jgi:hypothetical protein